MSLISSEEQPPILSVVNVEMRFGGLQALKDVSFDVPPGQVTAVIGPNGAGKTTLLSILAGSIRPTAGHVVFGGRIITGSREDRIVRDGLVRTYQNINLYQNLSIVENVITGMFVRSSGGLFTSVFRIPTDIASRRRARNEASEILISVGVPEEEHDRAPGVLPYASQRRAEIGRALAARPTVLLLDEPVAGMIESEASALLQLLNKLTRQGMTIVLVEHNMRFVMEAAMKVVVLNFGSKLAEATPDEIQRDSRVIEAYLGGSSDIAGT